ncbi:MAG TPA: DUF4129 domain-containing protein [Blastocatellia bacterium]|nr:DUF4129 domain-containing protein [Blastocatellia bacterium]
MNSTTDIEPVRKRSRTRGLLCPIVLLFCSLAAPSALSASTLFNYEQRVKSASEELERATTDRDYTAEGISHANQLLPAREQVQVGSRWVQVDNQWLHNLLDSYSDGRSRYEHTELEQAAGRLNALHDHLLQLEKELASNTAGGKDPQAEVNRILARPEFQPKKEDPVTRAIRRIKEKVYAFVEEFEARLYRLFFGAKGESSWLFRGLIVLVLAGAVTLIVFMARKLRTKSPRKKKVTILGEEIDQNMSPGDLTSVAMAAARSGDFRTAIRKLYIALLYELSERSMIELKANATNHEYLSRVSGHPALTAPMRYLTDCFDYFWYGMFPPSREDFTSYLARYGEAVEHIRARQA